MPADTSGPRITSSGFTGPDFTGSGFAGFGLP